MIWSIYMYGQKVLEVYGRFVQVFKTPMNIYILQLILKAF